MDRKEAVARAYLGPHLDSFWTWSEQGDVLTWIDGKTIAFREEIRSVLKRLAPQGAPPLGGIALLLAATRDGWGNELSEIGILTGILRQSDAFATHRHALQTVCEGLERIHQLPAELRVPVAAKAVIADMVFRPQAHRLTLEETLDVVEAMQHGMANLFRSPANDNTLLDRGRARVVADLYSLVPGINSIDEETIRLRMATGLESLPAAADVELTPPDAARALLATLRDDPELGGVARAALKLVPIAALPRPLTRNDDQQHGGVSDIANRGPLDRLLVSELAHDDLTLAVRIAMNEALYSRRETPPSSPASRRLVLLDVGLRSWGVPRIYITAVGLALVATAPSNGEVLTYSGQAAALRDVDLATRSGLVEQLGVVEPDLDLSASCESLRARITAADEHAEVVLVMTAEALASREMQSAITRLDQGRLFVATVNREGQFRLAERLPRGFKTLREATFDLDALFDRSPDLSDPKQQDLPAILALHPIPFRLPHGFDPRRVWYVEPHGALALTADGRVTLWTSASRGPIQIADRLPCRPFRAALAPGGQGRIAIITGKPTRLNLLTIDCMRETVDVVPLRYDGSGAAFCMHGGVLMIIDDGQVYSLSADSGEVVDVLAVPGDIRHVTDRFFFCDSTQMWYALATTGLAAHLEPVPLKTQEGKSISASILFDVHGRDGPFAITASSELLDTASGSLRRIDVEPEMRLRLDWQRNVSQTERLSIDGRRIYVVALNSFRNLTHAVVDPVEATARFCDRGLRDDRVDMVTRPRMLRHRFIGVGLTGRGDLALISRKQAVLSFRNEASHPVFARDRSQDLARLRKFQAVHAPALGFKLWSANWHDGSEAILDSRGLLHLRNPERTLETTLVLYEGELTGWASSGFTCGPDYFFADASTSRHPGMPIRTFFEKHVRSFAKVIHG